MINDEIDKTGRGRDIQVSSFDPLSFFFKLACGVPLAGVAYFTTPSFK